jgi:phospholipid/cholesterol/gamma-HCH transport system ATP-binding protein
MIDAAPLLTVLELYKQFGEHAVLSGVDLIVPRGSILSLLGRSGAGKSVLLKCLAGLLKPDAGEIRFDEDATQVLRCSYLFQANALFDSLTAFENVALPLEQTTRLRPAEIKDAVVSALKNLNLEKFADYFPAQLSGGMQKRLALARALVTRPALVLFDEPTAGLDPIARNAVFSMIRRYRDEFDFTAVVVTHDVPQALAASDQVALLEKGRIHLQGSPAEFGSSEDSVVRGFAHDTIKISTANGSEETTANGH